MSVTLKTKVKLLSRRLLPALVMVSLFLTPALLFAQNQTEDPAGNPDGTPPPAVPLTSWMGVILLVAGLLLSVWVIKRRNAKKTLVAQTVATTENQ